MPDIVLVNAEGPEVRAAVVENGEIAELHIERPTENGLVGNIYKGRVVRVLPGMQAAFVDIGLPRTAFLYAGDVLQLADESDPETPTGVGTEARTAQPSPGDAPSAPPIETRVREGQEVLVQVAKEPIGTKGARITTYISLAGRTLVFMPTVDHVGISRRIDDENERQRLRDLLEGMRPPGAGFIVRTVGEHQGEAPLRSDMEFLVRLWEDIRTRADATSAPGLIHRDLDLTLRIVRDLVSSSTRRIVVDDVAAYERIRHFIATFMPEHEPILELYQGTESLFDVYGIEHEVDRALQRRVWLKSGGYLVIDESEALTAIDVNTGRYVGRRTLEDTITKINLEAAKEVATQLRLRNIGGIIIVDFIDMELETNRQKVSRALADALETDRAKTKALPISELGLVEMTRRRVRDSLMHQLAEPCPYCEGRGFNKSPTTVCYEVLREIRRQGTALPGPSVRVCVHPSVADLLADVEHERLAQLEQSMAKTLRVEAQRDFHVEQFELHVDGN